MDPKSPLPFGITESYHLEENKDDDAWYDGDCSNDDFLPNKYVICDYPWDLKASSRWFPVIFDDHSLHDLSWYGSYYENKTYRVVGKFEKRNSTLRRTGNAVVGLSAIILTAGAAIGISEELPSIRKKQYKTYFALYTNGPGRHQITYEMTNKMTENKFFELFDKYLNVSNPPGIGNGLLDRCLELGNKELMKCLIRNFGDVLINKKTTLSDMIVVAVGFLFEGKLNFKKVYSICKTLIKEGAEINKLSEKSELLIDRPGCKHHSQKTVLDAVLCSFKSFKIIAPKFHPIIELLLKNGAIAKPRVDCCNYKFSVLSSEEYKLLI